MTSYKSAEAACQAEDRLAAISVYIILISVFIDQLTAARMPILGNVALGASALFSSWIAILAVSKGRKLPKQASIYGLLMLSTLYFVLTALNFTEVGLKHSLQVILMTGVFSSFSLTNPLPCLNYRALALAAGPVFVQLLYGIAFPSQLVAGLYIEGKNVLGGIWFYLIALVLFVYLAKGGRNMLTIGMALVSIGLIAVILQHRLLLAFPLVIAGCLFYVWTGHEHTLLAWVPYLATLAFTLGYVQLNCTSQGGPVFDLADQLLREYTNRSFYSGREQLWPELYYTIVEGSPFGSGTDMLPSGLLDTELSSHCLYLQVGLQVGYVGVVLLLLSLTAIWGEICRGTNTLSMRLGLGVLIALMIHQMLEVSLLQNQICQGILQWMILGMASSTARVGNK